MSNFSEISSVRSYISLKQQNFTWPKKYNSQGSQKSKFGGKLLKNHVVLLVFVFIVGAKMTLKPKIFELKKKIPRLHFWLSAKILTCKWSGHWYNDLHVRISHKNENCGLGIFFSWNSPKFPYTFCTAILMDGLYLNFRWPPFVFIFVFLNSSSNSDENSYITCLV